MQELKELLTGGISGQYFLAALILATLGIILHMLVMANYRDINSPRTPSQFKLMFFIEDNWRRFSIVWIFTYLYVRFGVEIAPMLDMGDYLHTNFGLFSNVAIGILNNWVIKKLSDLIKRRTKK